MKNRTLHAACCHCRTVEDARIDNGALRTAVTLIDSPSSVCEAGRSTHIQDPYAGKTCNAASRVGSSNLPVASQGAIDTPKRLEPLETLEMDTSMSHTPITSRSSIEFGLILNDLWEPPIFQVPPTVKITVEKVHASYFHAFENRLNPGHVLRPVAYCHHRENTLTITVPDTLSVEETHTVCDHAKATLASPHALTRCTLHENCQRFFLAVKDSPMHHAPWCNRVECDSDGVDEFHYLTLFTPAGNVKCVSHVQALTGVEKDRCVYVEEVAIENTLASSSVEADAQALLDLAKAIEQAAHWLTSPSHPSFHALKEKHQKQAMRSVCENITRAYMRARGGEAA